MSTLKATNIQHASSASANLVLDSSGNATVAGTLVAGSSMGWRNRIINGDMRIDQRNAGASVTVNTGGETYALDRWYGQATTSAGAFTIARSTVAPDGFTNSLLATVTTPDASIAASDLYLVSQRIEGFNIADLGWGTASAKTVTLSFWVRSSVTGTYGGSLANSAANRSYPFSYSIASANTWEQKTVTVSGDTSGTWLTDSGIGIRAYFGLGMGSNWTGTAGSWASALYLSATGQTPWISTNGATFYLTGVQLEVGTVATPFERRDYGRELIMAQRYYQVFGAGCLGRWGTATGAECTAIFRVVMRAAPTISIYGNGAYTVTRIGTAGYSGTGATLNFASSQATGSGGFSFNVASTGASGGEFCGVGTDFLQASAEL